MTQVTKAEETQVTQVAKAQSVVRSLKTLIPLLREKLTGFHRANLEWYREMGALLIEAKTQVSTASWGGWLKKNFDISRQTAQNWMQVARTDVTHALHLSKGNDSAGLAGADSEGHASPPQSMYEALGQAASAAKRRERKRPMEQAMRDLDAELFAKEQQNEADEVRLHREIALKFVDVGYKAMATRLHPDHGGSSEAMRRLKTVRDVFQSVAKTRRFT